MRSKAMKNTEYRNDNAPWEADQMNGELASSASVPHLLRQLTGEITNLFSKEVSLARAEVREAVNGFKTGVVALLAGGVVLLAGLIVLLMAAVYGLATKMDLWMAALIVGGAVTIVGLIMVASGKGKLDADALKPDRTMNSLREDRRTMKAAVSGGRV
jgi:hypothetical protein